MRRFSRVYLFAELISMPYRFERELEALRKELAEATSRSSNSSPTLGPQSDDDLSTVAGSPNMNGNKVLSPEMASIELSPDSSATSLPEVESKKDQ